MNLSTITNSLIADFLASRDACFLVRLSFLCADLATAQEAGDHEAVDYIKGTIREFLQGIEIDGEIDEPLRIPVTGQSMELASSVKRPARKLGARNKHRSQRKLSPDSKRPPHAPFSSREKETLHAANELAVPAPAVLRT